MKVSSRIERSKCGVTLLPWTSPPTRFSPAIAWKSRQVQYSGRWPGPPAPHARPARCPSSRWCDSQLPPLRPVINPLIRSSAPEPTSYFAAWRPAANARRNHMATQAAAEPRQAIVIPQPPKQELLALVDQYGEDSVEDHLQFIMDPFLRGYAPPASTQLVVTDSKKHIDFSSSETDIGGEPEKKTVRELRAAVHARLRSPLRRSLDAIYDLYRTLPEPRMLYLDSSLRDRFLKVLGMPIGKKDSKSMLRYFAVVSDMKSCGLPLRRANWNSAISYASRYVYTCSETEAESALNLWREMEQDAGIKANEVTFNIIFDVASKAGNFALAEMLYGEMEKRGFKFNRFHHVSLIHFFGLKQDGDGVRAAYKEMVEAGEMIDTVVLNCVMAGLLRCGEEDAAMRIYGRMKASRPDCPQMPERNYLTQKVVTKVLMMFAKVGREHPQMRDVFQQQTPMAPTVATYQILVNHFAVKLGDLSQVARLLDEMKWFQVPVRGSIFMALFRGFHLHGAPGGSEWNGKRLSSVWSALLDAFDGGAEGVHMGKWLAIWALRAFARCAPPDRLLDVYEDLRARWDLDPADSEFMINLLHRLMNR